MNRKHFIRIIQIALLACACPLLVNAWLTTNTGYTSDVGYSGVPGESACQTCHSSGNSFGSAKITFPNGLFYTPGKSQHLVLLISDSTQLDWGFQLTARQSASATTQAGQFIPGGEGYTQVICGTTDLKKEQFANPCPSTAPLQYIQNTYSGARVGQTRSAQFEFDWIPPASNVGNIVLYLDAVAGNGSDSTAGSHVYTVRYTLSVMQANQPVISTGGVVNGASYQNAISPASWVAINGSNLSSTTRTWGAADFINGQMPTSLDGVSVNIGGSPAYVEYISPTQINVVSPSGTALGSLDVQVTNGSGSSNTVTTNLQNTAPALFLWNNKYAVATRPDYTLVGPANLFSNATTTPAQAGDVIILWCTGLGPTTPAIAPGMLTPTSPLTSLVNAVQVRIGGTSAYVVGAALAPGFGSLFQVAIQVPAGVGSGDQPILLQSGNASSPAGVFLTLQ